MSSECLLSVLGSQNTVALTAPFIRGSEVLVGYALGPEEGYCACLQLSEFAVLCPSLYLDVNSKRIYHGLKRIWEFLDERGVCSDIPKHLNVDKVDDVRLMAYLLDPDASRDVRYGEYQVQEELTLAQLAQRYLGRDYPYRITDVYDGPSVDLVAEVLPHDAGLIFQLAEKLPSLMSRELQRLYSYLELPLMAVLNDMRLTGIGFDGLKCAELALETEKSMALLAQDITGGGVGGSHVERGGLRLSGKARRSSPTCPHVCTA
ncbi:MAG: hypothetical protein V2B18_20815 [Pseudomonadota bacterium]